MNEDREVIERTKTPLTGTNFGISLYKEKDIASVYETFLNYSDHHMIHYMRSSMDHQEITKQLQEKYTTQRRQRTEGAENKH